MEKKIKSSIVCAGILLLSIIVWMIVYPCIKKKSIKEYTIDYIQSQGYPVESINSMEILHSYTGKLLGYYEWRINVGFKKEPNILFWFSYGNDAILFNGVSSEPMLDKDDVIKYSEKFKNGTLFDN